MFKLSGVVPPMITPFDARGDIDTGNLERIVTYLSRHVQGLFICGSYGSGPMMSIEERMRVAELTRKSAGDGVAIVVHTGLDKHAGNRDPLASREADRL